LTLCGVLAKWPTHGANIVKKLVLALCLAGSCSYHAYAESSKTYFSSYSEYDLDGTKFLDSIDIKTGNIVLEHGVSLNLPDNFYYLDQADTKKVLIDAWQNPPGSSDGTLGMIFPKQYDPLASKSWGIEITFDDIGYVKDEDAASTDFSDILETMKEETLAANEERISDGFPPITLIGWASPPTYDATNKRLHWAKELKFGDNEVNTLNYNVRFLGRKGVLIMNYIAAVDQLPEIKANLESVLSVVNFQEGNRYSDFSPGVDTVAAVGIGGLVAGKVALKTGLFAIALVALKKFGFLILAPLFWFASKLKGRGKQNSDDV
jgi:uncharacterized membrane-anchored protein